MKKRCLIALILIMSVILSLFYLTACSLFNSKDDSSKEVKIKDENGEKYIVNAVPTRTGNEVMFGQYPQTEVKQNDILSELDKKAGDLPTPENSGAWKSYQYEKWGTALNMWYIDIVYNSKRYRGVYFTTNRSNEENEYTVARSYWFEFEPIYWSVLDDNRGELLLICNVALDSQEFSRESEYKENISKGIMANNYEASSIRSWLNDIFYNTAFTTQQKQYILSTTVKNNFDGNQYSCNDTEDKIFLLSKEEALLERYGFQSLSSSTAYGYTNVNNDPARCKKATNYAKSQACSANTDASYYAREQRGNACWWLRTPDNDYSGMASYVNYYGSPTGTSSVYECRIGVVPALRIKL